MDGITEQEMLAMMDMSRSGVEQWEICEVFGIEKHELKSILARSRIEQVERELREVTGV